jgi:hypothetical protein
MTDAAFPERTLPDGRILSIHPLTFGRWRILVMRPREFTRWPDILDTW